MVIDRFTGLLFSAARLPNVTVEDDRDSQDFVQAVFKKAKFWRTMHLARTLGGSLGSVLITCQLRRKRFSFTAHSAKVIHDVVWEDPDLKIPAGVLIQYLFEKEIEALDARHAGFVEHLRSLARQFQLEAMTRIIRQGLEAHR